MAHAGVGGRLKEAPLALALTLLVHALLLLAWLQGRPVRREAPGALREFSVLLPRPAARAQPHASARARPDRRTATAPSPAMPAVAPVVPPAAPPQPGAPSQPAGLPDTPTGAEIAAQARRDAGRAFRELNGGKSIVPANPDMPWARFRDGLDSAHIESARTETVETYTSPDGLVIYRFRQGSKVRCRSTGGVGLGIPGGYTQGQQLAGAGSAGGAGTAGFVRCPSGERDWVRH